jgi:hypothetical protein
MTRIWIACLGLIALVALTAAPAAATTMVELDRSELTWVADAVVEGVVEANSVERIEGQRLLRTVTSVRLTQVVKGELSEGQRIDVVELGGRLDGEETTVHSAAVFAPDERVLLFLEQRAGEWSCVGLTQGKLTLVTEADTGRDLVVTLQLPRGLDRFDEAQVQLPARRVYADALIEQIRDEISMGYVPEYRQIPGLPAAKDARFRAEAKQMDRFDVRWESIRPSVAPEGGER